MSKDCNVTTLPSRSTRIVQAGDLQALIEKYLLQIRGRVSEKTLKTYAGDLEQAREFFAEQLGITRVQDITLDVIDLYFQGLLQS